MTADQRWPVRRGDLGRLILRNALREIIALETIIEESGEQRQRADLRRLQGIHKIVFTMVV